MSLNQLYHDRGVALTRAQHAGSVSLRERHAAEVLLARQHIRRKKADNSEPSISHVDRFEVFRADQVRVSSTQFSGGDWHWRLANFADETLVEGRGYRTERECLEAVALLRVRACSAT